MTREVFKQNLKEPFERKDLYVKDEGIETFLDLNFGDETNCLQDWTFSDFAEFASEVCANWGDFWITVEDFDLTIPEREDEEE